MCAEIHMPYLVNPPASSVEPMTDDGLLLVRKDVEQAMQPGHRGVVHWPAATALALLRRLDAIRTCESCGSPRTAKDCPECSDF